MLFVALLAAVSCAVIAVPPPCGTNTLSKGCSKDGLTSFPFTDAMKSRGRGRQNMKKLIAMKTKTYNEREQCKAEGTCSHLVPPASIRARVDCVDGMAGEYPCSNVDMLSFLNFDALGYPEAGVAGNDLWVWHDTDTGDDYVVMGLNDGSSFVRVTDRENPLVIGILRTQTVRSDWRDMKVIGNYAYIVSEAGGHGMQVFDLTRLREFDGNTLEEFQADVVYDLVSNTHNIVANPANNRVFLVGSTGGGSGTILCDGGLHTVDVSDPMNPTFLGCYGGDGYVHDAECIIYDGPDTEHNGKEICFGYNEDTFTIVDNTDASNGILLSRMGYEGNAYSHQGWATEDRNWALLDDELDEFLNADTNTTTYVWNIQDLDAPVLENVHIHPQRSSDHNLYIKGNYAHMSNYKSGYRLMSLSDLPNLSEVAFFDVFPSETTAGFDGTWSNYPYFDDDAVAVSSITYGLFMLQPNFPAIERCPQNTAAKCK